MKPHSPAFAAALAFALLLLASASPAAAVCDFGSPEWRSDAGAGVFGVPVDADRTCEPDDPRVVAASVLGTEDAPDSLFVETPMSAFSVGKNQDLTADGDYDVVHLTVEILGVNEHEGTQYRKEIGDGSTPATWTTAPKARGLAGDTPSPVDLVEPPPTVLRVEEDDLLFLRVENTHHETHSFEFHGVDANNRAEGVEIPPGGRHTYIFRPEEPGVHSYGAADVVGRSMGLHGLIVVEENTSDNSVQSFNLGGGKVRAPSDAKREGFDGEYDLVYGAVDRSHRSSAAGADGGRDAGAVDADVETLNGDTYPGTVLDPVVVDDGRYRLNVLNARDRPLSLEAEGHSLVDVDTGEELESYGLEPRAAGAVALEAGDEAGVLYDAEADPDLALDSLADTRGSATPVVPAEQMEDGAPAELEHHVDGDGALDLSYLYLVGGFLAGVVGTLVGSVVTRRWSR